MAKKETNANYKASIASVSKELNGKERIMFKDTTNAIKIDEATKESEGGIVLTVDYYGVLSIHNEKSDTVDYNNYIIVDTEGNKYVTGSDSFYRSFIDIVDELADCGESIEGCTINIYRHDSKNYVGKQFLSCSLV